MLSTFLSGNTDAIRSAVIQILLSLPIVLLALSTHEMAHGYVANKLGDPTAKSLGRITLNPIKHLDPIGFICMLLFGFGWANPVPINTRYFKNPRRDMALAGAAGPVSNLILAVIFTFLLKMFFILPVNYMGYTAAELVFTFLLLGIRLNITLAVFNLLPMPPLDGSRILYTFLPPKYYFGVMKYERYIAIGIMLLLVFGILDPILSFVSGKIMTALFFVFNI